MCEMERLYRMFAKPYTTPYMDGLSVVWVHPYRRAVGILLFTLLQTFCNLLYLWSIAKLYYPNLWCWANYPDPLYFVLQLDGSLSLQWSLVLTFLLPLPLRYYTWVHCQCVMFCSCNVLLALYLYSTLWWCSVLIGVPVFVLYIVSCFGRIGVLMPCS